MTSLDELRFQQERRKRLLNLTLTCVVVLALIALGACGPSDVDIARSGVPSTEPKVVAMTAYPAERLVLPTTTVPPTTAAPTTSAVPLLEVAEEPVPQAVTPVAPAPTPAPAASGDCGGWEALVASYFPADQVARGCEIMMCESNGNPNAVSPTNDHGLWQINAVHRDSFDWSRRYDPEVNTAYAHQLWSSQGWSPWTCAR